MDEINYNSLKEGDEFSTQYKLSIDIVKNYLIALNAPLDYQGTLPTAVFLTNLPLVKALSGRFPQGTVHVKQFCEYYGEPRLDDEYEVTITIQDKYLKKGRQYLVYESIYEKCNVLICRQLTTQIFSLVN